MAYQTGTATDAMDLLDKLRQFVLGLGWTINRWDTSSNELCITNPNQDVWANMHADLSSTPNAVYARGSVGYSAAAAFDQQPGAPNRSSGMDHLDGPYTGYHFFADAAGNYVHVVVEVSTGYFKHMAIGMVKKASTYAGGQYVTAGWGQSGNPDDGHVSSLFGVRGYVPYSAYQGSVQADIDGNTNYWGYFCYGTSDAQAQGADRNTYVNQMFFRQPNQANALSVLFPQMIIMQNAAGDWFSLGEVRDLCFLNIKNLIPKQQITVGADTWMVFPQLMKGTTSGQPISSGDYGYAYKVIP